MDIITWLCIKWGAVFQLVGVDEKEREVESYLKLIGDDGNNWYQTTWIVKEDIG